MLKRKTCLLLGAGVAITLIVCYAEIRHEEELKQKLRLEALNDEIEDWRAVAETEMSIRRTEQEMLKRRAEQKIWDREFDRLHQAVENTHDSLLTAIDHSSAASIAHAEDRHRAAERALEDFMARTEEQKTPLKLRNQE